MKASPESKTRALQTLGRNLEHAAVGGSLFRKVNPGHILWLAPLLIPSRCKALLRAIQRSDPSLDQFVLALMEGGFDSVNGRYYVVPKEVERVERYIDMVDLKRLAAERLEDDALGLPARAAWRAVDEERAIYGKDGSIACR